MPRYLAVMQGRLLPPVGNRIQSFPGSGWSREFALARAVGLDAIEWTIDLAGIWSHPILDRDSEAVVHALSDQHGVRGVAVTCDFFMQGDVYDATDADFAQVHHPLASLITSSAIRSCDIVVPLVDGGRPRSARHWEQTARYFDSLTQSIRDAGHRIAFEMDCEPSAQREFVDVLDESTFGINFDMGNSASMGYDPRQELSLISDRVIHVHVKDRALHGTTVPLGEGNVNFAAIVDWLNDVDFVGSLTLQCARQPGLPESDTIATYIEFCRREGLVP